MGNMWGGGKGGKDEDKQWYMSRSWRDDPGSEDEAPKPDSWWRGDNWGSGEGYWESYRGSEEGSKEHSEENNWEKLRRLVRRTLEKLVGLDDLGDEPNEWKRFRNRRVSEMINDAGDDNIIDLGHSEDLDGKG